MSDLLAQAHVGRPFFVEIDVRGYEIDSFGHVNNAHYLSWLEHARWQLGAERPVGDTGILPLVRHVDLDYRVATYLGDRIKIGLWYRKVGQTSFTLGGAMRIIAARKHPERVGRMAMQATMVMACIDATGNKTHVPDGWRRYFPKDDPGDTPPAEL